jgi:hypothetical protein
VDSVLVGRCWFFAALAAIFSRIPGTLLHPQFFAEDGWVWYLFLWLAIWATCGGRIRVARYTGGVVLLLHRLASSGNAATRRGLIATSEKK